MSKKKNKAPTMPILPDNTWEVRDIGTRERQIGARITIDRWTKGVQVEKGAEAQLNNVANLPFVQAVAVMPDVHFGKGATVGSVIVTDNAVIPAAVGVDIGCGMDYQLTSILRNQIPDSALPEIRKSIEEAVPAGFALKKPDVGAWPEEVPTEVQIAWEELEPGYRRICEKYPKAKHHMPIRQLGTLGSGNHFIEIVVDESEHVGVMLHSGSRGPGKKIADVFMNFAQEDMKRYYVSLPGNDWNLAFLPRGTDGFRDYMEAVTWAQRYAQVNRELMRTFVIRALKKVLRKYKVTEIDTEVKIISCHHNYVTFENHSGKNLLVTRKGAISARKGQPGIIPGSMGARSYIVEGLGSKAAYNSASHGAGRLMSRAEARRRFTLKDHRAATEGIECDKGSGTLDETPNCYKSIDDVMEAQKDLVSVIHELRQIINVKGTEA